MLLHSQRDERQTQMFRAVKWRVFIRSTSFKRLMTIMLTFVTNEEQRKLSESDFKSQMLYQLNTVILVTSKAQNRLKSDKLSASINILKSVCTEIWVAKD